MPFWAIFCWTGDRVVGDDDDMDEEETPALASDGAEANSRKAAADTDSRDFILSASIKCTVLLWVGQVAEW